MLTAEQVEHQRKIERAVALNLNVAAQRRIVEQLEALVLQTQQRGPVDRAERFKTVLRRAQANLATLESEART